MKRINVLSLIQAHNALRNDDFNTFLKFYGITLKQDEINDLSVFVSDFYAVCDAKACEDYYVGYRIPQIGKEFDLLRIGEENIVNIEIKREATQEKVQKQLERNNYYLAATGKTIYNFTYVSRSKDLYFLTPERQLQIVELKWLSDVINGQIVHRLPNINSLFDPSHYLVSPFNSTQRFLGGQYFLTHQQEEIKNLLLSKFTGDSQPTFHAITGSAGTGKTLLIYDVAKELICRNSRVLIIHCGYLNEGQQKLNLQNGWDIIPIKNYAQYEFSNYSVVIIDEAQRIYPNQLSDIEQKIRKTSGQCVFSYDKVQTLANKEEYWDIDGKITSINPIVSFKLTDKIRTNKEIASFIKALFDKSQKFDHANEGNIELNYFNSIDDAKDFLGSIQSQGWEVLRFTPSQYNNEHHESYSSIFSKTSHSVIGQEFDNVAVVIDQYFMYSKRTGKLTYTAGAHYAPIKMLFQNLTRTRKKLNIVIISNTEILTRCLAVIGNHGT